MSDVTPVRRRTAPLAVLVGATLCFTTDGHRHVGCVGHRGRTEGPSRPGCDRLCTRGGLAYRHDGDDPGSDELRTRGRTAQLVITVGNATETSVTPDLGLTCGANSPSLTGTGFTQQCATDSLLPSGATLSVSLTIAPLVDPRLVSVPVRGTVGSLLSDTPIRC